jgi:hypothetical protein
MAGHTAELHQRLRWSLPGCPNMGVTPLVVWGSPRGEQVPLLCHTVEIRTLRKSQQDVDRPRMELSSFPID